MNNTLSPGNMVPATATTPNTPVFNNGEPSPSPRQRPFTRLPSMQNVNTNVAQNVTITPASARSVSSVSPSPYLSSVQCSPLAISTQPNQNSLTTPAPLELPESIISSPPSSMATVLNNQKPDGLVRKLSHGTKKVTDSLRRKASQSSQSRRDVSRGPVARRRSDSKTIASAYTSEPESNIPDVPEGLGLSYAPSSQDDMGALSDVPTKSEPRAEIVALAVPAELIAGCKLTKATKRKRQEKLFFLDAEGSRVSWTGTVSLKYFYIDDITSIRTGAEAASHWHNMQFKDVDEERCFTINYAPSESSRDVKTLHLLAGSERDLRLWVDTLEALAKHREELMTEMIGSERQSVLRAHWDSEIARQPFKEGSPMQAGLDLGAISNVCRKLHIHCPRSVIEKSFHAADTQGCGRIDFEQFRAFVARLRERVDLRPIFDSIKTEKVDGVTKEAFMNFLEQSQGITISNPVARTFWANKFDGLAASSQCLTNGQPCEGYMDFHAFTSFLLSKDCHVYANNDKHRQPLNRPLNEYFISSSHNTYLTGRQVNGTSSVEAYMTALRRGCRSVEIDCWDGENDQPRVTHGFTRTTSVPFADVISAINRCAFDASPYPVILSLEVHCNPIQQSRMVQIMKETFGDEKLVLHLLHNHHHDLPSPEELKYKILVKVKAVDAFPTLPTPMDSAPISRQRSTSSPYRKAIPIHSASSLPPFGSSMTVQNMMSPPESTSSPTDRSMTATSASSEDDSDANSVSPITTEHSRRRVKTSKITQELAALGTYLQGFSYRTTADLLFHKFNHIFSVNENTAVGLCQTAETKAMFEEHNVNFMCRVYPKNLRINSSNFDPNTFWRRGVQMVALNWQTFDMNLQMNLAMFAAGSDQTGYVLKPDYLRKQRRTTGGFEHRLKLPRYHVSFSVKVISAQQLPLLSSMGKTPSIDPFVEVQMFSAEDRARGIANGMGGSEMSMTNGYHGIGVPYSRRTKVVRGNGYNPQFNDLIELSLDTKYPELVFVRFIVYQSGKNAKQLAVFTAKLDSLNTGYRHVPLYNNNGEELIFSSLFCQINKGRPRLVPASLQDLNDRTSRQTIFRGMLSRGMSGERGRERGLTQMEEQRRAGQLRLNEEIEQRKGRAGNNLVR